MKVSYFNHLKAYVRRAINSHFVIVRAFFPTLAPCTNAVSNPYFKEKTATFLQ